MRWSREIRKAYEREEGISRGLVRMSYNILSPVHVLGNPVNNQG
jgi:hypothetical protein